MGEEGEGGGHVVLRKVEEADLEARWKTQRIGRDHCSDRSGSVLVGTAKRKDDRRPS